MKLVIIYCSSFGVSVTNRLILVQKSIAEAPNHKVTILPPDPPSWHANAAGWINQKLLPIVPAMQIVY